MSFLAPLFMLGAIAVAAPILFHLIRRSTRDKIPISSLMFLQPSPPRVTKRSRIENWLLLLLRCLVICLLALGFARPFLQKPLAAVNQGTIGQRIMVLIDTSASMRRDTLWEQLLLQLEEQLENATSDDELAIYTFGNTVKAVLGFDEWTSIPPSERAAAALARVQDHSPGWSDTRLGQALLNAVDLFEDREKNDAAPRQKRLVVFSDAQAGSRMEGLQGYEWPRDMEVDVRPLQSVKPTNAGVQILSRRQPSPDDDTGQSRSVAVRVTNAADSDREQFRLAWGNSTSAANAAETLDVYVPPGQSRILQMTLPETLGDTAKVVLSGDEQPFDNQAHYVPPQTSIIPVLFLGQSAANDPQGMHYYLDRAFQDSLQQKVEILAHTAGESLTNQNLTPIRLAIVTRLLDENEISFLKDFVTEGKTILLTIGSATELNTLISLTGVEGMNATEAPIKDYAMLGQIDFSHPLFAPFADPRYSDFTKIHFWKHRNLSTNSQAGARVLARFEDEAPALLESTVGRGHLFVLTAGWQPADSQLALSSKFVPLLYSLLDYSGSLPSEASSYFVGDEVLPKSKSDDATMIVRKPDGVETNLAGAPFFTGTDQPGIYTVTEGNNTYEFAVNVAPDESRTAPMSLDTLENLGVPLSLKPLAGLPATVSETNAAKGAELEGQQKLWKWFLVLALGLLLVETWLAGRLSRRPVAEPV